jgi:hypothetical protein
LHRAAFFASLRAPSVADVRKPGSATCWFGRMGLVKTGNLLACAALLLCLAGCASDSATPPVATVPQTEMADPERGQLLYRTACEGCHAKETHWRGRHVVRDWPQLVEQVTRWQSVAGQTWGRHEIDDVAAYLNRRFYELPCPLPRCSPGTVGVVPAPDGPWKSRVASSAR